MSENIWSGDTVPSALLPASHCEAARGLVDFATAKSIALSNKVLSVPTEGTDANLLRFSKALLREFTRRGWPMVPHQYVRGEAEQNRLFREGRSRARFGQSPHNHGMAVDIVHFRRYWALTSKEWAVIGLVGKEVARRANIKVTWGGDWKFYDPAHWQLTDWSKRAFGSDANFDDDGETFKGAFAKAREAGFATFIWKGREYTTELAE